MRIVVWMLALMPATSSAAQTATFRVDGVTTTPSTVVATIEPRPGAPGYFWLRLYFYSSLTAVERKQAERGGVDAQRTHWVAVFQLGLDKQSTIWQVDLSVPGHACTLAASDRDARIAIQTFRFGGGQLSLKAKGLHVCDLSSLGIPNQRFEWDIDVDTQVVESRSNGR